MANVWTKLAADLEVRVQDLVGAIRDAFEDFLGIVSSQDEADSNVANIPRPVVQTLFETLNRRKDLALKGTGDAIEEFRDKLLALNTDALAPVRTAFIGRYMEDIYHAANMEYGKLVYSGLLFQVLQLLKIYRLWQRPPSQNSNDRRIWLCAHVQRSKESLQGRF